MITVLFLVEIKSHCISVIYAARNQLFCYLLTEIVVHYRIKDEI